MKRRDLIAILAGAASSWPWIGRAAAATLPRVSFLARGFGADTTGFDVIRDALRGLGQIDGQTYQSHYDMTDDPAKFSAMVADVVRSKPSIIVTVDGESTSAVFAQTHTIPMVAGFVGDPVASGFTDSIARPSANVTGVLGLQDIVVGKRIQILHEIVPSLRRIGIVYDLNNAAHNLALSAVKKLALGPQLELVLLGLATGDPIERVLDRPDVGHLDGLVVLASPGMMTMRQSIIAAELARRLPAIHSFTFEVEEGALAAYGAEPAENFQRTAEYVDRLLRGATIADLPFDSPRNILLSLNLRTARALGLTIPTQLLATADKVIE